MMQHQQQHHAQRKYPSSSSSQQQHQQHQQQQHAQYQTPSQQPSSHEMKNLYHYSNLFNNDNHFLSASAFEVEANSVLSDNNSVSDSSDAGQLATPRSNEIGLLKTRIDALQEIINIQSQEIDKGLLDNTYKNKLHSSLLQKWRDKVFEMLIQIKSMEIALHDQQNEEKKKLKDYVERNNQLEYELSVSRQREADAIANLEIAKSGKKFSDATVKKMETRDKLKSKELSDQRESITDSIGLMKRFFNGFWVKQMDVLQSQLFKLEMLEKRALFSAKRVHALSSMLKGKNRDMDIAHKIREEAVYHAKSAVEEMFMYKEQLEVKGRECEELKRTLTKAESALREELMGIRAMKRQFVQLRQQSQQEREETIHRVMRENDSRYTSFLDEFNMLKSENARMTAQITRLERELDAERKEKRNEDKYDYYEQKLAAKDSELRTLRNENNAILSALRQHERSKIPEYIHPLGAELMKENEQQQPQQQQPQFPGGGNGEWKDPLVTNHLRNIPVVSEDKQSTVQPPMPSVFMPSSLAQQPVTNTIPNLPNFSTGHNPPTNFSSSGRMSSLGGSSPTQIIPEREAVMNALNDLSAFTSKYFSSSGGDDYL